MRYFFPLILILQSLLNSSKSFAVIQYRSAPEILSEESQALDFQFQSFSKKSSLDEQGVELVSASGESFSVKNWNLLYTRGLTSLLEAGISANLRSVKSNSVVGSATNSGLQSIGIQTKYLVYNDDKIKNAIAVHVNKAMYTNTRYSISNPPPNDQIVLGDDGVEYGLDYLFLIKTNNLKYDLRLGFNRPSANLSSELPYNIEAIYQLKNRNIFLIGGVGGIYSMKGDNYTSTPTLKPLESTGNSRLYNSINRENFYLYGGVQYALGNFILGLKGESIITGRSTDSGNMISFNLRWEKNQNIVLSEFAKPVVLNVQEYFAQGFVEKISNDGVSIKINMGTTKKLVKDVKVDIFDIDNYSKGIPIASGVVIEARDFSSFVKITKRYSKLPVQVGYLARAY